MDLNNRVAFITGAAQGIGKATALVLARYGADIVATDVSVNGLKDLLVEIRDMNKKAEAVSLDVCNKSDVISGVRKAIKEFGQIDILVNCAGIIESDLIIDLKEQDWDKVMAVNTKGTFLVCQAVAKEMIKRNYGKIINISSQAAKTGEFGNAVYCASKAAVIMLTQVLALELAEHGINANAICPGYTDTSMVRSRGPLEGITTEKFVENLLSSVPLKRLARPEEIAELVAFLASDKADYITGEAVLITGGKEVH